MLNVWGIKQILCMADTVANIPTGSSDKRKLGYRRRSLSADLAKRRFNLTPEQIDELQACIDACSHAPTRTRYEAVLLYGTGVPVDEITERLGCSRASLMNWCRDYRLLGIKVLEDRRLGGNNIKLSPQQMDDLVFRINTVTPRNVFGNRSSTEQGEQWTVEDLYKAIKDWYGVRYRSRTSYYTLLHSSSSKLQNIKEQDESQTEE
jgi:transposase